MRKFVALGLVAGVALGCDAGPAPAPTATTGPTALPSFAVPGPRSTLSPDDLLAEIDRQYGPSLISFGEGAFGVVQVGLRANAEHIARELVETYGPAVEVTVGLFPYPPPAMPKRACQNPRSPIVADHPPLSAVLFVEPTVVSGGFYQGRVRITNVGLAPYDLSTSSSFSTYLFRPNETLPIGISEGGSMGTGVGRTLAPGENTELPASGGTASCDLAVGYVLPAGAYLARALIDDQDHTTFEVRFFWSEPAPIEVLAP